MYIQITDKCNMECLHCGYSCSPRNTNFMTLELFKKCIDIANKIETYIVIGGGEPTIHPLFKDFICQCIIDYDIIPHYKEIHILTNGKGDLDIFKLLIKLKERELIYANLSQSQFHEPINDKVIQLFGNNSIKQLYMLVIQGRATKELAKKYNLPYYRSCMNDHLFITPLGDIYPCGCQITKIGHIMDDDIIDKLKLLHDDNDYLNYLCERHSPNIKTLLKGE